MRKSKSARPSCSCVFDSVMVFLLCLSVWLWWVTTLLLLLAYVGVSHVKYYSLWMAFPKGPHLAKWRMPLEGAIMPGGNFAPDLDLPITLDRAAPTSIYQQLCEQFRRAILDGRISRATRLP